MTGRDPPTLDGMELVDNAPLRTAVAAFAAESNQATYWEVLRNTLQGDILFDITGSSITMSDDGSTINKGSTIGFLGGTGPDGGRALFAYTRQAEAVRMHPETPHDVQTLGQPAASALEFAASQGYAWLYIDPAGPTCALQLADVDFALRTLHNDAVKDALATGDKLRVIDALAAGGQLLYGVEELPDGVRVRTSATPQDEPVALAFTSAPEVVCRNATDAWSAIDISRIVADALAAPFAGLVLNPAGPWMMLDHDDLLAVQSRL